MLARPCRISKPQNTPRTVGGPAVQAPTSKRQDFHKNYIARLQFHRRGEHCSPAFAAAANPKIFPAPLAGLRCRPLQAKGKIFVKIISLVCNFIVGASIARPLLPYQQTPKYATAPLAGLQCRPLQANDSALHKKNHPAGGPKFLSGLPRPGVFFCFFPFRWAPFAGRSRCGG